MRTAANDNRRNALPFGVLPRGLRREQAAAYLGISPGHFDKQRAAGAVPAPMQMFGVWLWDRQKLDALFDGAVPEAQNDNFNEWDAHWKSKDDTGAQSM